MMENLKMTTENRIARAFRIIRQRQQNLFLCTFKIFYFEIAKFVSLSQTLYTWPRFELLRGNY